MEEYKFKEVDHPLFGKIITTQDEAGNILYKATEVAKAIGFIHFGQRLKGKVVFKVITMKLAILLAILLEKKSDLSVKKALLK